MKNNLQQSSHDSQLSLSIPSGYKQTEIGVIPEDWEVKRLGDVLTVRHGRSQHGVAVSDGRYPIFASGGEIGRTNTSLYDKPSVLIGRKGTIDEPRFTETPFWTVDTLFYTEILGQNSAKFIFYRFCMIPWRSYNEASGVPSLNTKTIENIEIALPQPSEQVVIAKALSDMDALLEGLDRLIAKKRDLKQATMQALLTPPAERVESGELKVESGKWKVESGELKVESDGSANSQLSTLNSPLKNVRLPGFEGEWEVKRLGELTSPGCGRIDPSRCEPHEFCVELEHIGQGSGFLLGWSTTTPSSSLKATFNAGDVLFGKLRAYLRKFWLANREGVCSTEIWVLTPNENIVTSGYLYQIVQMNWFIEAASTAYGTHMPRSDWRVVREIELYVPPIPEQVAIAAVLSDMDAEIKALEQRRDKTADLKQAMMQELLTGKIRLVRGELKVESGETSRPHSALQRQEVIFD